MVANALVISILWTQGLEYCKPLSSLVDRHSGLSGDG